MLEYEKEFELDREIIYTDRYLLKHAIAALLEADAKNQQKKYPASWAFFAEGPEAAERTWEKGKSNGNGVQEKWMLLASCYFSPDEIREAFQTPEDNFDETIEQYRKILANGADSDEP